MLITTSAALKDFCDALRGAPYITVDTEFLNEKTYYAKLCLVQVAYGEHAAAIDPLASGLDWSPLEALLVDPSVVKVLHAATQDLAIFLRILGQVPAPVFDTQIAATVCGLGEQPGYAKLVSSLLGVRIDKASQATDWSLRPLSTRQLNYALSDVTHLCKVYENLVGQLEASGRSPWVAEEMAALLEPSKYVREPMEAWRRIRMRHPSRKSLALLRELTAWREEAARERDTPRKWVVRDDALTEVALNAPGTKDELARVRSLKPHVARGNDGAAMLAAVERALALPKDQWPALPKAPDRLSGHEALVALLQALLQQRCAAHGVAPSVVAKRADLDRIATEEAPDVAALRGWRREVFGADALEVCAGRMALTGEGGKLVTVVLP
jgi:ribonuclease D